MERIFDQYTQGEIDEYIFEISQDKLSAEKQIADNQKLLSETLACLNKFQATLNACTCSEERNEWEKAIQNSTELRDSLQNRIAVLNDALEVLENVIHQLST